MPRILLVAKTPLARRLTLDDRERLAAAGAVDTDRLDASLARHEATLGTVRAALAGEPVREVRVEDLHPDDADGVDLVVTVGGDGTVFTANTVVADVPFLTVNSDPERSIGHFTRATSATAPTLIRAWCAGSATLDTLPRLEVRVGSRRWRFLNDCLFTSTNPAAMSRYLLDCRDGREYQRSSGVWVATAAGSTGAIRSAGAAPIAGGEALLFQVREPFHGRDELRLLNGRQITATGLQLTPGIPGMALYLDGPNITVPLRPGATAHIAPASTPLRLLRLAQ
jgi:NAD+ kinase